MSESNETCDAEALRYHRLFHLTPIGFVSILFISKILSRHMSVFFFVFFFFFFVVFFFFSNFGSEFVFFKYGKIRYRGVGRG